MYAIVEVGGRQWKVEPGARLEINRVDGKVGGQVTVERVLLAHDGKQAHVGTPFLKDARIVCEILSHDKGPKVIAYHFRRRENYRKTVGHRQSLTQLIVKSISVGGVAYEAEAAAKPKAKAQAPEGAAKPVAKRPRVSTRPKVTEAKAAAPKADAKKTGPSKSTKHPKK